MKFVNEKLCIAYQEAIDAGISENTLKSAKQRATSSHWFVEDPSDKRRVLLVWENLKDEYKEKIQAKWGDPYKRMAIQPIRELVKYDHKAEQFYLDYKYDEGKVLSTEHVKKYTAAASFLNMLVAQTADKKQLKKLLNLSIEDFYTKCCEIITADMLSLPTSYRRLLAKVDEYKQHGYACLVSWKFGNKLAAKVRDEVSESALLELIAHPNQYDDVLIVQQYNQWAKKSNYKPIKADTVGVWRRKKESEIIMQREGNAALNEKYLKQAKGFRPTAPLLLVENDDNHLDLLFINPEDSTSHKHFNKYKAIVVIDSFNDYVLGYAYDLELNKQLVRAAYINAMYHIRSITNGWYLPHEVKNDRWALKELKPFYESIGNYFPTPVGSKHRGYIEPFFGNAHWKRCLKLGANNYTGNNITARHRGVNVEALERAKNDRPMIGDEAIEQIENFFHRLRHMPQSNGISKHEQWLQAWNTLPTERKRLISDEQFLLKFGIEHNANGEGLRITNAGLKPQINGVRYNFDLAQYRMEDVGKRVSIIYDPYDMSRVLVTDHQQFRMMAYDARLNSRALADASTDSRVYLNSILNEKRDAVNVISEKADRRREVLSAHNIDAETILQAGVLMKEVRQAAEVKVLAPMTRDFEDNDYLNQI